LGYNVGEFRILNLESGIGILNIELWIIQKRTLCRRFNR